MDFLTARRAGTTYGKASRKPLVHDLFDYRNAQTAPQKPESELSRSPTHDDDTVALISDQGLESRPSQIATKTSLHTLELSSLAHNPPSLSDAAPTGTFSFDISSSDEEKKQTRPIGQTNKRRKLARPLHANQEDHVRSTARSEREPRRPPLLHDKTSNMVPDKVPVVRTHEKRTTENAPGEALETKPTGSGGLLNTQKVSRSKPALHSRNIPKPLKLRDNGNSPTEDNVSTDASENFTDRSVHSVASRGTNRRKRPSSPRENSSVPSPTALGLVSLKLTPEKRLVSRAVSSAETSGDDVHGQNDRTPRKVRSRLIDRLDAPESRTASEVETALHVRRESEGKVRRSRPVTVKRSQPEVENAPAPRLASSGSSQGRTTYSSKARTTYGKERSYLNDMVSSLDTPESVSGQPAGQPLLLGTTTSDLATQLELEDDDSDEQMGLGRLKSIHELRQAGTNNRFDREFQTLLEDVETAGSSSRSLRLAALLKLAYRLEDTTFLQHVITSGCAARLAGCASYASDSLSAMLLLFCLSALSSADASSATVSQIFNAGLHLSPDLLKVDDALSDWVQERRASLTKSMARDMTEFEKHAQTQPLLPDYPCARLRPSAVALYCLNTSVRALLRLGTEAQASKLVLNRVVDMLQRRAATFANGSHTADEVKSCRMSLQFLEACSIASEDVDIDLTEIQYRTLGKSLANIIACARDEHEPLDQNVLRVLVSLSNNKPRICRSLAQSPVLGSVLSIIDKHFLLIASQAEKEETFQHQTLDSVILALGCLLNFAECDEEARRVLSATEVQGRDCITSLLAIFNSQVGKYQDAETEDQTQVMVAFGYLSILLCALSLDGSIRLRITELLEGKPFSDVCAAAETFFNHLRTLDKLSDEGGGESMSTFTQRFSAILETLKTSIC